MNPQTTGQISEPVNPFNLFKPEWEVSRKSVHIDSLVAKYDIEPPDEIAFPPTTHHMMLLQLSHGEEQLTRIGNREYSGTFTSGEFFLHPARREAYYSWTTTDEAVVFLIEPAFLCRIARETECLDPDKIELKPILRDRDPHIEYMARSFLKEMQTEGLGGRLYSEALATQLAINLLRNYCTYPLKLKQYSGGLSPNKLRKAIDYIQANLEHKFGLNALAIITKTSPYHFSRLFKQSTGLTPYQYVIQQRIELGKRLLEKEDLPIVEIALMCGFASQSSFTTTFRKLVGVTPKSYRVVSRE